MDSRKNYNQLNIYNAKKKRRQTVRHITSCRFARGNGFHTCKQVDRLAGDARDIHVALDVHNDHNIFVNAHSTRSP